LKTSSFNCWRRRILDLAHFEQGGAAFPLAQAIDFDAQGESKLNYGKGFT
jgi:hypothetical protein